MEKFSDNKIVTLKDLRESKNYNSELLENLEQGNYKELLNLSLEDRTNKDYMEPLLYAIRNDKGSWIVYKFYGENLQDDFKLASKIIKTEPELIENTPISNNKQFFVKNISENPEIIKYMNSNLKEDTNFIQELKEVTVNNKEARKALIENCDISKVLLDNPELSNDKEWISMAIAKDISFLSQASEALKNDKEFLREESLKNSEVIDYVVDNIQEFGLEGINGVRETSREFTIDDCMNLIDEMAEKGQDRRYEKVKNKIQEKGLDDIHTVRWVTAMVAQRDDINSDLVKKVLNYSILTMEKTKQDLSETGEMKTNIENVQELITPQILNRLKGKLEIQGVEIDGAIQEKLDNYQEFYKDYHAKFQEEKKQKMYGKDDVGKLVKDVTKRDLDKVTGELRAEVKDENNKDTKDKDGEVRDE